MPKPPTPFSFITWDECFQSGYDWFCQDLWDWPKCVDDLYPSETPFSRLPWVSDPELYDPLHVHDDIEYREGTVSVWLLRSEEAEGYFSFDEDSCEWEPFDSALFWNDLGFVLWPNTYSLATSRTPQSIVSLLERFSTPHERYGYTDIPFLGNFAESIIESCNQKTIKEAGGLYCVYDYDYFGTPVFGKFCSGMVEYLGAFSYERGGTTQ